MLNPGHGLMFAPESTYFPELFGTQVRYTLIGFQLSAAIDSGFTPVIAAGLAACLGGPAGGFYHAGPARNYYLDYHLFRPRGQRQSANHLERGLSRRWEGSQ
jgi:hypothetical protein